MTELKDFDTLAEAQAYTETKERMISQDMIVSLLTQFDCVSSLQNSTDEKAKGFWLAVSSGVKEFNVMNSHSTGVAQQALLTYLVSVGAVTADFQANAIAYANQPYQPFANTTQEQFEVAKLTGESKATIEYDGGDKLVTKGRRTFNFDALLTEPAKKDIKVTVTCTMSKGEGSLYIPSSRKWNFTIPQDELGYLELDLPINGLHRWVKFYAALDIVDTDCTVTVTAS